MDRNWNSARVDEWEHEAKKTSERQKASTFGKKTTPRH
jgi:hypothetical protein